MKLFEPTLCYFGTYLMIRNFQKFQYLYRLEIINDSNYISKKVQIDIEEIIENDNSKKQNLIPAPMRWTHGNAEPRDILPHQTVYLDICEVKQTPNEFITLAAPNIMPLQEMSVLKKGKTKIIFRHYQENGQTSEFKLKVDWNGNENFDTELRNLPIINLVK